MPTRRSARSAGSVFHLLPVMLMALSSAHGQTSPIQNELARLEQQYGGHLGVMAKNLVTGETVAYNATERFPTASVIKLPVMAAFFHEVDRRAVDPDMRITLLADDKKQDSGVLQFLSNSSTFTLLDAVKLMIVLSDNTGTNLVLDRMGATHMERLKVVNDFLVSKGLKNTRLLNRLYSWDTKQSTPEGIRYGIGVSTPEDMVTLLEALHRKTLAEPASCDAMMAILKAQFYGDMIPQLLPRWTCSSLEVAHKTGSVQESKVDVGLVLSDRATIAMAIFIDKHPDHDEEGANLGTALGAHVARALWNHFTGDTGYEDRKVLPGHVDWNRVPGGKWGIYRSTAAPFPHPDRIDGLRKKDGTTYPRYPHYSDSSVVVFVPDGLTATPRGVNVIVHYHGHMNDNMGVLERYDMVQNLVRQKTNAILVLPQGPYRARDSFGGKVEDRDGFARLVRDVLATMLREQAVPNDRIGSIVISAHSGGYHPAAFSLEFGGLSDRVTDVFLFDAFYGNQEYFQHWLQQGRGTLYGAYTDHLRQEHVDFELVMKPRVGDRLRFTPTTVDHDSVVQTFFADWLSKLGPQWERK